QQTATPLLALTLGIPARATTISSGCPTGLAANASTAPMIRHGQADNSVAGGTDAAITPLTMASFATAGLSSTRNSDPERASRPFDLLRDSGIISEGAGMLILENYETAIARGVSAYLEITGYGTQGDSYANDEVFGLGQTMRTALESASKTPEDIDYICAYGPGHPAL